MVYLTALLDKEFRGIKNWKDLARSVGIPRQDIIGFEQPKALESPTKFVGVCSSDETSLYSKSSQECIARDMSYGSCGNY